VPQGLHERERAVAIDLEILDGIAHGIHVVHLACEVKDQILTLDEMIHGELVSHIAEIDAQLVINRLDIEEVAALARQHVVHDGDLCPEVGQGDGQVRTHEA